MHTPKRLCARNYVVFLRVSQHGLNMVRNKQSKTNIVSYSMSRTGSTLVFNILRFLYPETIACHPPAGWLTEHHTIVGTYRHPIDSLLSNIRISEPKEIDDPLLLKHLNSRSMLHGHLKRDMDAHKKKGGVQLKLKYEMFWDNYEFIFDKLEDVLAINISNCQRKEMQEKYGIKNALRTQRHLANWDEVDKETRLHGGHIKTPRPYHYKQILTDNQINLLTCGLSSFIREWENLD